MLAIYKVIEDEDGQLRTGLAIALPVRIGQQLLWRGEAASSDDALQKYRESVHAVDRQLSLFERFV